MSKTVSTRLEEEEIEKLNQIAKEKHMDRSSLIRNFLFLKVLQPTNYYQCQPNWNDISLGLTDLKVNEYFKNYCHKCGDAQVIKNVLLSPQSHSRADYPSN